MPYSEGCSAEMKILLYGINYHPELTGIGKYSGELCDWLSAQGHEVKVVTAPPYYPAWKVGSGYSSFFYKFKSLNGVNIYRCPLWVPRLQSGRNRILHLLSFMFSSAPITMSLSLLWRPDCIITVEPPLFCALPAIIASRLGGSMAWLHVQDLEIDAAVRVGLLKHSRILDMVFSFERWLLGKFDRVSSISNRMIDSLTAKGVSTSKLVLFPNWVDTSVLRPIKKPNKMRSELGIDENILVALYSGNMGKKQGLDLVIEVARSLANNTRILFVLCGDGAIRKDLVLSSKGMDNVMMLPLQPVDQLNDLLNMADIHMLPQQADMDDLVMPSKLLGMLATGRPVVCCSEKTTELAGIVEKCGLVVPIGDAVKFAAAVVTLTNSYEERTRLGRCGRSICSESWEKKVVLSAFMKHLKEACIASR